jgi:hypothetical protein
MSESTPPTTERHIPNDYQQHCCETLNSYNKAIMIIYRVYIKEWYELRTILEKT